MEQTRTASRPHPKKPTHATKLGLLPGMGKTRVLAGVIAHYIYRTSGMPGVKQHSPQQVIDIVREGLPFQELESLRAHLDLPMEKLAQKVGMSKATLHRRKAEGRLAAGESDRAVRFARLLGLAIEVFENEDDARGWLTSPQFGLGGAVPLDYAETEIGAREVEDLLGRIEHGVYS